MCDELGDDEYMQAYVEEMGSTSLCSIHEAGDGCSQRQHMLLKERLVLGRRSVQPEVDLKRLLQRARRCTRACERATHARALFRDAREPPFDAVYCSPLQRC